MRLCGLLLLLAALIAPPAGAQGIVHTPRVHALTGARIVQGPGRILESGTVVIRDGVIEAVGDVAIPADARVWALDSLTVYPGLIDLGMILTEGGSKEKKEEASGGSLTHELGVVTPDRVLADELELKDADREGRRAVGITTVRVIPGRKGMFRGQAAVLNLGDGELGRNLLVWKAGPVLAFGTSGGTDYPVSLMGSVAVLRQTFLDARWYRDAHAAYAARPTGTERPPVNNALAALDADLAAKTPFLFLTGNPLDLLRAVGVAKEFGLRIDVLGSGLEYQRLAAIRDPVRYLVVPVNFPEAPAVDEPGTALGVTLESLRYWDEAPANPARLQEAGIDFALTAEGLKDVSQFPKRIRRAIEAGLSAGSALAALTTRPAAMAGLGNRLGTIDPGKIANLVITSGDLFGEKTVVREVWVDGNRYPVEEIKPPVGDPVGTWEMSANSDGQTYPFVLTLGGESGALTAVITLMGNEIPAEATQSAASVTVSFPGDSIGMSGSMRFTFTFKDDSASGSGKTPDGEGFSLTGTRTAKAPSGGGQGGSSR